MTSNILISGPVSLHIIEYDGTKFYLMGDVHTSPVEKSCQQLNKSECDTINYTFDAAIAKQTNCWSLGALLLEWFTYNKDMNISTDFYIEAPFTKTDSLINNKLNKIYSRRNVSKEDISELYDNIYDPLNINSNWISSLELIFNDCLTFSKKNCEYLPSIRMHYTDTRKLILNDYKNVDLYDINTASYKNLINSMIFKSKTDILNILNETRQLLVLFQFLSENISNIPYQVYFNSNGNAINILNTYRTIVDAKSLTGKLWNQKIDNLIASMVVRDGIKMDRSAAEMRRLQVINPYVYKQLTNYMKDQINAISNPDFRYDDTYAARGKIISSFNYILNNAEYQPSNDFIKNKKVFDNLAEYFNMVVLQSYFSLLRITALHMDAYTISRVFIQKSINKSREVIFYCGDAHIEIYFNFFKNYIDSDVLFSSSNNTIKCLKISTSSKFLNPYIYRNRYIEIQNTLNEIDNIIDNYTRNQISYEITRKSLGELLNKAVIIKKSYIIYKHLITLGAPITYYSGNILSKAVLNFGVHAINIISAEKLTNYMKNKDRAYNLVNGIIKYYDNDGTDIEKIITYLIENDKRQYKHRSHSYRILYNYFKEDSIIYELIQRKIYK